MLGRLQIEDFYEKNGMLNMNRLLTSWTEFYRQNIGFWKEHDDFKEAAVHLLLYAFLQRVVNGGGRISREYALGNKRVDICIMKPYDGGDWQRDQFKRNTSSEFNRNIIRRQN